MDSVSVRKRLGGILLMLSWSLCCASNQSVLVLSDIHLDANSKHTMALAPNRVSYLNDLDLPTYQAMIARLRAEIDAGRIDKPDYIFLLGDIVGHFLTTKDAVSKAETLAFRTLKHYFPDTPLVYTFGNHDSFVSNYGPFMSAEKQSPLQVAKALWPQQEKRGGFVWAKAQCEQPAQYPCVIASQAEDGYYSAYLANKLRAIALNSVLFSPKAHAESQLQAGQQQLRWLAKQLEDADKRDESVLLLMHIPPGDQIVQSLWNWSSLSFWRNAELQKFLRLIDHYHDAIIGVLAGHTHKDELKIIRNKAHHVQMGVYVSGSLATIYGNAPSIRSYTLHEANHHWSLQDYTVYQYYKQQTSEIGLRRLYRYRDYYCTQKAQSINACLLEVTAEKMQHHYTLDNKNFFETFKHPENILLETKHAHE